MTTVSHLYLIFHLVGSIPSIPECFIDGQVRLAYNTTMSSNSTEYEEISGIIGDMC